MRARAAACPAIAVARGTFSDERARTQGHWPDRPDARVRECAFASAQATAQIEAARGRASFLGERALGHVDPGSRSAALIIGAVCDTL